MANRSYPNIETRKVPGSNYRIGYAKNGVAVRVFGSAMEGFSLSYGASEHTRKNGTMFKPIMNGFRTLEEVSRYLNDFAG